MEIFKNIKILAGNIKTFYNKNEIDQKIKLELIINTLKIDGLNIDEALFILGMNLNSVIEFLEDCFQSQKFNEYNIAKNLVKLLNYQEEIAERENPELRRRREQEKQELEGVLYILSINDLTIPEVLSNLEKDLDSTINLLEKAIKTQQFEDKKIEIRNILNKLATYKEDKRKEEIIRIENNRARERIIIPGDFEDIPRGNMVPKEIEKLFSQFKDNRHSLDEDEIEVLYYTFESPNNMDINQLFSIYEMDFNLLHKDLSKKLLDFKTKAETKEKIKNILENLLKAVSEINGNNIKLKSLFQDYQSYIDQVKDKEQLKEIKQNLDNFSNFEKIKGELMLSKLIANINDKITEIEEKESKKNNEIIDKIIKDIKENDMVDVIKCSLLLGDQNFFVLFDLNRLEKNIINEQIKNIINNNKKLVEFFSIMKNNVKNNVKNNGILQERLFDKMNKLNKKNLQLNINKFIKENDINIKDLNPEIDCVHDILENIKKNPQNQKETTIAHKIFNIATFLGRAFLKLF